MTMILLKTMSQTAMRLPDTVISIRHVVIFQVTERCRSRSTASLTVPSYLYQRSLQCMIFALPWRTSLVEKAEEENHD